MGRKPILPDEFGVYTEKQITKLKSRAMNSSLYYLQQMPKTEHQLRENLRKKQIPQDIIDETMQKLIDVGWVNDRNFAENFIFSKRKYEKLGSSSIKMKLIQKGIESHIIDEFLNEVSQDELRETAIILAEKKLRSLKREPDRNKKIQKIVSHLAYRGYNGGVAFEVAKEVVDKNAENDPDPDELVE